MGKYAAVWNSDRRWFRASSRRKSTEVKEQFANKSQTNRVWGADSPDLAGHAWRAVFLRFAGLLFQRLRCPKV
jgi:hypothetical protein